MNTERPIQQANLAAECLGERLKSLRVMAGHSLVGFAERLNTLPSRWREIEHGRIVPELYDLNEVYRQLGLTASGRLALELGRLRREAVA